MTASSILTMRVRVVCTACLDHEEAGLTVRVGRAYLCRACLPAEHTMGRASSSVLLDEWAWRGLGRGAQPAGRFDADPDAQGAEV